MRLADLKQKANQAWVDFQQYRNVLVQPENFKSDVKREFGDLRRKSTWQKAYASFEARATWESGLTEIGVICFAFNFQPTDWQYEIRHLILEEYLAIPGALEHIARGLEWVYQHGNSEDRECANGILTMVGGEQGSTRGLTTRFIRQLKAS